MAKGPRFRVVMRMAVCVTVIVLVAGCAKREAGRDPAAEPSASDYAEEGRRVVERLVAGEFAKIREDFDETMTRGLSERKLREGWAQYQSMFGRYKSHGEPEVIKRGPITVVNVALTMERRRGQARISYDSGGNIIGLFLLRTGVPVP